MFSLFKRKKPAVPIPTSPKPDWASFFDDHEYSRFIAALQYHFRHREYTYAAEEGTISLQDGNNEESDHLGLQNVGQKCKQHDKGPDSYKRVIADHFNSLKKGDKKQKAFYRKAQNFEAVKKYISIRLYHHSYLESIGRDKFLGKDFAGDLFAMIVFDLPYKVVSVEADMATTWNRPVDELYELGLTNVRKNYTWNILNEPFNDYHIWFVHGDHFFATNIVFDIEQHRELIGTYGSLVGIPHRHAVLIYPIENMEITKALTTMVPAIHGMNEDGPGSLSNKLFWYKDGAFIEQYYNLEENNMNFKPTDDFLDMLNQLEDTGS